MSMPSRRLAPLLFAIFAVCSGAWAAADRPLTTSPLMQNEVRTLKQMLDYVHFNRHGVTPEDYPRLITDYMALLDPQRLYFLASDEESLRRLYAPQMENALSYSGNIDAAFRIFAVFEERLRSRVTWVNDRLKEEFDLTTDESYTIDRSKEPWPATPAAADDVWNRRLKLEYLNEILAKKTPEEARQTIAKRFERFQKNSGELQPEEIQERFLTALTKLYDPHSSYLSALTLDDFNVDIKLALVGIGAVLSVDEDGYCTIVSVVPGGPADLSNRIKAKDRIIAVQQEGAETIDIVGMRLRQIVQMIRGTKGTKVTLTVVPRDTTDQTKRELVVITRDTIKLNQARASAEVFDVPAADGTLTPVGVISLNNFYGEGGDTDAPLPVTATNDVAELITKLRAQSIAALVIDLRRNGGGLLSEAINLAGLFIDQGPVVQVRDSLGRVSLGRDNNSAIAYDGPLAILTSRFSASASEIFAGALQNYGRAVVIGDSATYGKGTVQVVFEMQNYLPRLARDYGRPGAAKLTTQKFYLPNGASTQKRGVVPDIAIPSIDDYLEIGEAREPNALIWDEIDSAPFDGHPLNQAFVAPLLAASQQRQSALEEFAVLKRNIEWFRETTARKAISLNLERRQREKAENEAINQQFKTEFEALAKIQYASREVLLDDVIAEKAKEKKQEPKPPVAAAAEATAAATEVPLAATPSAPASTDEPEDGDHTADPKFDVHLREAIRVVTDSLQLSADHQWAKHGSAPPSPALKRG